MSEASNNNLDWHAAQAAQEIISNTRTHKVKEKDEPIKASDVENLSTKTLGVLQENGVYAVLLYLYSRSEGEEFIAKQIRMQLLHLTFKLYPSFQIGANKVDVNASVALDSMTQKICYDLDRLLLVKQLWEQVLIYARYGAKARGVEDKMAEEAKKAKP